MSLRTHYASLGQSQGTNLSHNSNAPTNVLRKVISLSLTSSIFVDGQSGTHTALTEQALTDGGVVNGS